MRFASLVLTGLAAMTSAHAAEPDVAGLEREVATLRAIVQRLQARVDRLEKVAPPSEDASAAGATRAAPALAMQASAQPEAHTAARAPTPAAPIAAQQLDAGASDPGPEARLRINWSKIAAGMSSTDVSSLLGEPSRRLTLDGRSVWYYIYPALGNGSVFFTASDRVSSHQSPFPWGG
jgi:hypothetical protein